MSNKSEGNKFEQEFCDLLFQKGFWVHNMISSKAGQPADIIAVKNGKAFLIDCKVCSDGFFRLSRIEPNQNMSMTLWQNSGNGDGMFALKFENSIIMMIPFAELKRLISKKSRIFIKDAYRYGMDLERWLYYVNHCFK